MIVTLSISTTVTMKQFIRPTRHLDSIISRKGDDPRRFDIPDRLYGICVARGSLDLFESVFALKMVKYEQTSHPRTLCFLLVCMRMRFDIDHLNEKR